MESMTPRAARSALVWAMAAGVLMLVALAYIARARAHEWYPRECCNEVHCREIPAHEITRTPQGWRLRDGRLIPLHSARSTPAPHQGFHICEWRAGEAIPESYEPTALVTPKGKPLCFFIPDAQF